MTPCQQGAPPAGCTPPIDFSNLDPGLVATDIVNCSYSNGRNNIGCLVNLNCSDGTRDDTRERS